MRATNRVKVLVTSAIIVAILVFQNFGQARPDEPPKPKNLKVLPKDISHDELIKTMKGFSAALGVKCTECHVSTQNAEGKLDFDFASDGKPEKTTARGMMKMVKSINGKYLSKIGGGHFEQITCVTCHRGNLKPMVSVDSLPKK